MDDESFDETSPRIRLSSFQVDRIERRLEESGGKRMSRARRLREAFEELGTVLGHRGVLHIGDAPQMIANFLESRRLV